MHVAQSLEAMENQEIGHGCQHWWSTQTRFSEEEGPETEAACIVDQILAKLGPKLRQSRQNRDPKRHPSTPGPQRIRSMDREMSPAPSIDSSQSKGLEKTRERNRDTRHLQIGADQETERGHPNAISARDMGTS